MRSPYVGSLLLVLAAGIGTELSAQTLEALTTPVPRSETRARAIRLEVSLEQRTLWAIAGADTLLTAPVAVASGQELRLGSRTWRFETPVGTRTVKRKRPEPVWTPPDWHYAEAAVEHGLRLARLPKTGLTLDDGRRVSVRGEQIAVRLEDDGEWHPLPEDEHVVFDSTLYIPPIGSRNRQIRGALGRFALDLGDGYLLHGTPDQSSVGRATTHGCLRLRDADIEWLFWQVPVGATVVIR